MSVRYDRDQPVVIDGQSIALPVGKITALIGPNGSGKSTLLKTLARQLPPETGQIVLDGRDIATLTLLHQLEDSASISRLAKREQANYVKCSSCPVADLCLPGVAGTFNSQFVFSSNRHCWK